jgi:3-oxoacyl-[acyl-carrier protein] reductase
MTQKDRSLEGAVALVTGGSRGIGRAVCEALGGRGALVAVNYVSREDAAGETAELVRRAGGEAALACFDVADREAVKEGVGKVAADHGGLHILVNNAGVAINGLLMRFRDEQWARTMAVNLFGAFAVARAASSFLLKSREHGRIVNVSSVVGEMGNTGQAAYAATKSGLIGLTKALAREFASRGVCVNAVAPGYIESDMTDEHVPAEQRARLLDSIPLGRIGTSEEVADTVAFLAGPEAAYITGQVIRVNGGMLM